jgi:hypothetical protein
MLKSKPESLEASIVNSTAAMSQRGLCWAYHDEMLHTSAVRPCGIVAQMRDLIGCSIDYTTRREPFSGRSEFVGRRLIDAVDHATTRPASVGLVRLTAPPLASTGHPGVGP